MLAVIRTKLQSRVGRDAGMMFSESIISKEAGDGMRELLFIQQLPVDESVID